MSDHGFWYGSPFFASHADHFRFMPFGEFKSAKRREALNVRMSALGAVFEVERALDIDRYRITVRGTHGHWVAQSLDGVEIVNVVDNDLLSLAENLLTALEQHIEGRLELEEC